MVYAPKQIKKLFLFDITSDNHLLHFSYYTFSSPFGLYSRINKRTAVNNRVRGREILPLTRLTSFYSSGVSNP